MNVITQSSGEMEELKMSCDLMEQKNVVWYGVDMKKLIQYLPELLSEPLARDVEYELQHLIDEWTSSPVSPATP